jgi:hypothetical protein
LLDLEDLPDVLDLVWEDVLDLEEAGRVGLAAAGLERAGLLERERDVALLLEERWDFLEPPVADSVFKGSAALNTDVILIYLNSIFFFKIIQLNCCEKYNSNLSYKKFFIHKNLHHLNNKSRHLRKHVIHPS